MNGGRDLGQIVFGKSTSFKRQGGPGLGGSCRDGKIGMGFGEDSKLNSCHVLITGSLAFRFPPGKEE